MATILEQYIWSYLNYLANYPAPNRVLPSVSG